MGRVSLDINLNELSLEDCNQLLIKKKVKANAYEKFKLLSVTGGVPRYINEIKPNLSADDNIRQLCFISSGILFREFDDIFHDLFSRESEYYKKMVQILVNGSLEYTDICEQLGLEKSGYWSCYLDELVKAGFLKKAFTWNIKTGKISRFNQYRLSDNYLRFYLKYIAPNKVKIANHLFAEKQLHSLPAWDSIIGLQFENLVLNNARRIWKKLHISANDIIAHGPYFQKKNQRVSGCQIDYLIETRHNTLIVCEIKFSKSALDTTVIKAMQEKIAALQTPKGYACWPVLICVNGVSDAVLEADYFTHIIHFADFLGEN